MEYRFEKCVENIYNQDKEVILTGALNRDLLNEQNKNDWLDFTISLGLNQLIIMPTRVKYINLSHIHENAR